MKRIENGLKKAVQLLWSACLIITLLLCSVDLFCFNRSFYQKEYEKLGVAETIQISDEDLTLATEVLLDYIQDKRDDLHVEAAIAGQIREVFNQREIDHMVDVKNLYLTAMTVRNLAAGLVVVLGILIYLDQRASKKGFRSVAVSFIQVSVVFGAVFAALGFYAAIDFQNFWWQFHQIFFTGNDLWILDPNTDILIMMVPQEFFFDLVFRIVMGFAAAYGLCLAVAAGLSRKGSVK